MALSVVSGFIGQRWKHCQRVALLQGAVFGGAAVIGMMHPLVLQPGVFIDGRSVMISLCGLFFGPVAVAVAGGMALIYRILQGGMGVITGVLVILSSALAGLVFHFRWTRQGAEISVWQFLWFGLLVHAVMLLLTFSLPHIIAISTLKRIGLPVLLIYPLATVLIGKILSDHKAQDRFLWELRESEEAYRRLSEDMPVYVTAFLPDGTITYANAAEAEMAGMNHDKLIGLNYFNMLTPENLEKVKERLGSLTPEHPIETHEQTYTAPDSSEHWQQWTNRAFFDENGRALRFQAVGLDITERRRTEAALRESEDKHRFLMENSLDGIYIIQDARYVLFNHVFQEMTGYTEEELKKLHAIEIIAPESLPMLNERWQRTERGEPVPSLQEFKILRKDGALLDVETKVGRIVFEGRPAHQANLRDITERKRTEAALRENEERLNQIAEESRTVIWEVDAAGLYTYVSHVSEAVLGYRPEELIRKKHFYDLHPDAGREDIKVAAFDIFTRKAPFHHFENAMRTRNGQLIWVSTNGIPILDANGTLLGYRGWDTDATERKQATVALRENENLLNAIFETAQDSIFIKDVSLRYIKANAAMASLFELDKDDVLGKSDFDLFGAECVAHMEEIDRQVLAGETNEEFPSKPVCGEMRHFHTIKVPLRDSNGQIYGLFGIARDITLRKRAEEEKAELEEQFRHAQKMESVGRLAGGMAHDLNNMLVPIIGYGELLLEKFSKGDARKESVVQIVRAGERARDLVRQLLAFSRKQVLEFKPINMNNAVADFRKLLRHAIREDVVIEFIPAPSVPLIRGDIGQLEQVIMNLAVNAQDAMPDGGKLTIEAAVTVLDEACAAGHEGVTPAPPCAATSCWPSATPATAWMPGRRRNSSNPFLPPRKRAKAPAWVWPWSMALSSSTTEASWSTANQAKARR
ncbi:MAG: PAS domain S-box protein [bacterium]